MMPGDVLDVTSCELTHKKLERVTDENRLAYLQQYAKQYEDYFTKRKSLSVQDIDVVFERLQAHLQLKLNNMQLANRIQSPLYISFLDHSAKSLKIDFKRGRVEQAPFNPEEVHYHMMAPSWEIARVLDGHLTWEDFSLTFRMKLSRAPDVYQPLVQGFLILEPEDLDAYCNMVLRIESRSERILVETAHGRFVVDRYCPHQGGDLKCAWIENERYLTCPRHRWQFDLLNDGQCLTNNSSVNAVALDEDTPVMTAPTHENNEKVLSE
jgi:UDP-MurNAc hydroxylase